MNEFWTIIASILGSLSIVGAFAAYLGRRMIAEQAVTRKEYFHDKDQFEAELEEIRRFDGRLHTIESKVDGLHRSLTEYTKSSEAQLTGSMSHVRDRIADLKDLIEAKVGKRP